MIAGAGVVLRRSRGSRRGDGAALARVRMHSGRALLAHHVTTSAVGQHTSGLAVVPAVPGRGVIVAATAADIARVAGVRQ